MPELVYRCTVCHNVYAHESLARHCEQQHKAPASFRVEKVFWHPTDDTFPEKISVTLDGVTYSKIYQRVSKE